MADKKAVAAPKAVEPKKEKKPVSKTYYAAVLKTSIYVPAKDENGKALYQKLHTGEFRRDNRGDRIAVERSISFEAKVSNPKLGTYCELTTSDPDTIAVCDALAAKRGSDITSADEWKKAHNKAAYDNEKRAVDAETRADELAKSNAEQAAELERLQAEFAKLKEGSK